LAIVNSVLVPASGGPAGINTIKSLRKGGFWGEIVATDADPLSAGFFIASSHEVMPLASNEDAFFTKLADVVQRYSVNLLMPTSQTDGYIYSKRRDDLSRMGAIAVISDEKAMQTCIDKLMLYDALSGKFNLPYTTAEPETISEFPVIAKPRSGKGSRNVFQVRDRVELDNINARHSDMIFQEYLPGIEYTVDVLSDLDRKAIVAVPRIRLETKGGISTKGKVVHHPELQKVCMQIAESIGIRGPCCIQMKESSEGELKLVEVNPRMGGGTIFAALAGVNFPKMIIDMAEGRGVDPAPEFSDITVIRYFDEIVVKEKVAEPIQTSAGA
jgi:carbamoyl-phosphate synthase large subunit